MSEGNYISDEDRVSHFSMIPHIVDEMALSPYAVRLYVRLKRRVHQNGNGSTSGESFETTKNLALACKMSTGQVSKAKKELKEAGLIHVVKVPKKHGEFSNDHITIIDIWDANRVYFSDGISLELSSGENLVGKEVRKFLSENPVLATEQISILVHRHQVSTGSPSEQERS